MINQVISDDNVLDSAIGMARGIAVMDEHAIRLSKQAINRTYDAMGMREALQMALDLDVEITSLDTPDRQQFRDVSKRDGLKAALAWRDSRFENQD